MDRKLPKYRLDYPVLPSAVDAAKAEASSHALAAYLENHPEGSYTVKLM